MQLLSNKNSLIAFVEAHIREHSASALSEHAIIKALSDAGLFNNLETTDASLLLFQKHFLSMHALYLLQDSFYKMNRRLHISPLAIYLEEIPVDAATSAPTEYSDELRSYYLDLSILEHATSDSVEELQRNFFRRYQAWQKADESYKVMDLASTASWKEIQAQYRRLIQTSHPDKGGDSERFQRIQKAYEQLKLRHLK